jgi:hypothetical protein
MGGAAGEGIDGERKEEDGLGIHLCVFFGKAPRFESANLFKSGFECGSLHEK